MKKCIIYIFVVCMAIYPCIAFAASNHGEAAPEKKPEKKKKVENKEAKLENALNSLSTTYYIPFEQSVFFFEKMGEPAVAPLVEKLKDTDDQKTIANIIYVFGRLGKNGTKAVPVIMPYLKDENPDIRAVSVIALGKIGSTASYAVPSIEPLLNDSEKWISDSAKEALKRIGTEEAKKLLANQQ